MNGPKGFPPARSRSPSRASWPHPAGPRVAAGGSMFLVSVRIGRRLNAWNTNPMRLRRSPVAATDLASRGRPGDHGAAIPGGRASLDGWNGRFVLRNRAGSDPPTDLDATDDLRPSLIGSMNSTHRSRARRDGACGRWQEGRRPRCLCHEPAHEGALLMCTRRPSRHRSHRHAATVTTIDTRLGMVIDGSAVCVDRRSRAVTSGPCCTATSRERRTDDAGA